LRRQFLERDRGARVVLDEGGDGRVDDRQLLRSGLEGLGAGGYLLLHVAVDVLDRLAPHFVAGRNALDGHGNVSWVYVAQANRARQ
jgi:hypothetical protein